METTSEFAGLFSILSLLMLTVKQGSYEYQLLTFSLTRVNRTQVYQLRGGPYNCDYNNETFDKVKHAVHKCEVLYLRLKKLNKNKH